MIGDLLYFVLILSFGIIIGGFLGIWLGVRKLIIDKLPYTGTPGERIKAYLEKDIISTIKNETNSYINNTLKPETELFIRNKVVPEARLFLDNDVKPVLKEKVVDPVNDAISKETNKIIKELQQLVDGLIKEAITEAVKEALKDISIKPNEEFGNIKSKKKK